jgi:hypothetical protein
MYLESVCMPYPNGSQWVVVVMTVVLLFYVLVIHKD